MDKVGRSEFRQAALRKRVRHAGAGRHAAYGSRLVLICQKRILGGSDRGDVTEMLCEAFNESDEFTS